MKINPAFFSDRFPPESGRTEAYKSKRSQLARVWAQLRADDLGKLQEDSKNPSFLKRLHVPDMATIFVIWDDWGEITNTTLRHDIVTDIVQANKHILHEKYAVGMGFSTEDAIHYGLLAQ